MRKFIKTILKLLLFILLIDTFYFIILYNIDFTTSKSIEIQKRNFQKDKWVTLGNSLALDGINSSVLEQSFSQGYNISIPGIGTKSMYELWSYKKSEFDSLKFIIIGFNSKYIVGNSGNNPLMNIYSDENKGFIYNYMKIFPSIIKLKWLHIELLKRLVSSEHRNAFLEKGQLISNKVIFDNSNVVDSECYPILDRYVGDYYLSKIISESIEMGIRPIIVEMPLWKDSKNSCPVKINTDSKSKIIIFNLNSKTDELISDDSWLSRDHLNLKGSLELSLYLRELIKTEIDY